MSLETQIAAARNRGDSQTEKQLKDSLQVVSQDLRREELARKYINDLKGTVKTEEDYADLKKRAYASANMTLEVERKTAIETAKKADAEKWLANDTAASKTRQQNLELDILRARASGNETLAKELEGSQRVAQLASEIFEASCKEGMSRDQLVALQNSANAQARERYNLEKSISEEAERQNLAKDAQAKIEDIILTNKIEQLKAQGQMKEAQALSDERDIRRTMAGLQGVSEEDKKKLADMMRQTNGYKTSQSEQRSTGGSRGGGLNSVQNSRRSPNGNGGDEDVSSAIARKNSMSGGGGGSIGGLSRRSGRPVTVSAKYADQYAQFKEVRKSGAIGANVGWTDFRDGKTGGKLDRLRQVQARGILDNVESAAREMSNFAPRTVKKNETRTQKMAASAALNGKLEQMGTKNKNDAAQPQTNSEGILKEIKSVLTSIQSDVRTLGTKGGK